MTFQLKNISYNRNGRQILDDVSFSINEKKFVAITGPNGSGKSTLAKIIIGIEKPDGGQVLLDGKDVTNTPVYERAKMGVAFAFQQPVKFKGITVSDILLLASDKKATSKELNSVLNKVGLESEKYLNRQLDNSLSGGELKRIEIATAMLRKPKIAIFDEPEAGIDLWSFSKLVQIFRSINRDSLTIVITHQEKILNIADEIIVLDGGRITQHGPRDKVLKSLKSEGN